MKKIIYIIFALTSFLGFTNIVNGKEVFKCTYDINFKGFGSAQDKNIKFELLVGDTAKNTSISSFDSLSGSESLGGLYITKQVELIKDLYKTASANKTCPAVSFEFDGGTNIQMKAVSNYTGSLVKTTYGKFSSDTVKEAKEKIICKRTKNLRNESNIDIEFTFYELNGKKYWRASGTNTDNSSNSEANGLLSVGNYTFNMTSDFIEKVYSDEASCKSSTVYLKCLNGTSERSELTLTKPSDSENCSYNVNDAKRDNGGDILGEKTPNSYWDLKDKNTINFAKKVYNIIKIIVPVLIVVLSIVDFIKVFISDDEKIYKGAWTKFIKRILVGILLFVLPLIISLLINVSGISNNNDIWSIFK